MPTHVKRRMRSVAASALAILMMQSVIAYRQFVKLNLSQVHIANT